MLNPREFSTVDRAFSLVFLITFFSIAPATAQTLPPTSKPSPSSASHQTPAIAPASSSSYRLGTGDQVEITVFGEAELSGSKVIAPDGTVTLPYIGSVLALDRTPSQFAQDLQTRLQSVLKRPRVTIGVTNFRPLLVNVAGEVQRPGPIQLRSVPTDPKLEATAIAIPTVTNALLIAGGITRDADIRKVVLKRNGTTIAINLWDSISSENAPPDYLLQDGDSLYIPKLTSGEGIDRRLIARSTLAPKTIRVRVVGEVKKPGEVEVPPNSSISGAVAIAGGPTDKAKLKNVTLVRLNDTGRVEKQAINLENLVDSQQVLDGDVVMVPKSSTSSLLDFAGQLFSPLGAVLNLFRR